MREVMTEAWVFARELEAGILRAESLNSIAEAFAEAGFPTEALAVFREIEVPVYAEDYKTSLHSIVKALMRIGRPAEALDVARQAEVAASRAVALTLVANFWLEHGQVSNVESLLEEIQSLSSKVYSSDKQSSVKQHLAIIFAKLHRYRDARELAKECSYGDRLIAYAAILREYHIERNPSLAWLFAEEASDAEEED